MMAMTGKFVILHHAGHGPEHWDFMLEQGDALATWQCPVNPAVLSAGESITCPRLPDHRLAYLTYEGAVSRNRGEVRRVAQGEYQCLSTDQHHRQLRLVGREITSLVELRLEKSGEWSLKRLADENFA
jgi:hypothetical protein